jgi:hypothetical protein
MKVGKAAFSVHAQPEGFVPEGTIMEFPD